MTHIEPGRTETALAALSVIQLVDGHHGRLDHGRYHHLCDAHAILDVEGLVAMGVVKQHLDLAAVVRVDGAGRVEHGDAMLERQAGARPDLRLKARLKLDGDAGGDQAPLAGRDDERVAEG